MTNGGPIAKLDDNEYQQSNTTRHSGHDHEAELLKRLLGTCKSCVGGGVAHPLGEGCVRVVCVLDLYVVCGFEHGRVSLTLS